MSLPPRILAIDTASEACSVALFEGETLLAHDHRVLGRGHAEALVPMIAALPGRGRADEIRVSLGPGSFTGVRIGIAAARALGFAWSATVRGYPTFALLAAMALRDHADESDTGVTVCTNGGHGEWFVQNFGISRDGRPLMFEDAVRSLNPTAASAEVHHRLVTGNRARELAELHGDELRINVQLPDARRANLLDDSHLTARLSPIYGRGPDATVQAQPDAKSTAP